ncbi:MAG TPA: hypothetical protein V6C72_19710, partial [Chroococcales cyanobacterium]
MKASARNQPAAYQAKEARLMAALATSLLINNLGMAERASAAATARPRLAQSDSTPKYPGAPAQPSAMPAMPAG